MVQKVPRKSQRIADREGIIVGLQLDHPLRRSRNRLIGLEFRLASGRHGRERAHHDILGAHPDTGQIMLGSGARRIRHRGHPVVGITWRQSSASSALSLDHRRSKRQPRQQNNGSFDRSISHLHYPSLISSGRARKGDKPASDLSNLRYCCLPGVHWNLLISVPPKATSCFDANHSAIFSGIYWPHENFVIIQQIRESKTTFRSSPCCLLDSSCRAH